jgi:hypothetical protein
MQRELARNVASLRSIRVQFLCICARRHHKCSELGELSIGWQHARQSAQHPTDCDAYSTTTVTKQQHGVLTSVWLANCVARKPVNVLLQPRVKVCVQLHIVIPVALLLLLLLLLLHDECECPVRPERRRCV